MRVVGFLVFLLLLFSVFIGFGIFVSKIGDKTTLSIGSQEIVGVPKPVVGVTELSSENLKILVEDYLKNLKSESIATNFVIKYSVSPREKTDYNTFQALFPDKPQQVTFGCKWWRNDANLEMEWFIDPDFGAQLNTNAEFKNAFLRSLSSCMLRSVLKPNLDAERFREIQENMFVALKEAHWAIY